MNISTRLKLAGAFAVGFISVIGAVLISSTQEVKHELIKNEVSGEMLKAVTALRYLTLEYVLRHEERAKSQWRLRHASLSTLLAGPTAFPLSEEREVIEGLRDVHKSVNTLFTQLVTIHEDRETDVARSSVLEELEARLIGQITNKTQAMITSALNLSEQSRAGVLKAQNKASAAVAAFGGIVVLTIAGTLYLVFQSISRPLTTLRNGMVIVGSGNLNYRLDVTTKDEIGDLARVFDAMTEKLKGTTVSRDELVRANDVLRAEVIERQQAEKKTQEQLERLNLLHQITRSIGARQDLTSVFQVVVRSLEDQLPLDFCSVCSYDQQRNELTVTNVGIRSEVLATELAMSEHARIAIDENGLSQCVRGQLVYEPDISEVAFPFPQRLAGVALRSLVMAPLLVEDTVFGVLVAARLRAHSFSSGDCEFVRQLSEHVALAAHQTRLYSSLQQAYDDLRKTQQTVLQQERLRALGQMASGIAHDINNAISPVSLYIESLLETESNLSARARGYLEVTERAIDDVAATVARMREFYRQREPQLTLKLVQLNRLILQVVDLTRARWNDMPQQRGIVIKLQTELAPDLPDIMGVDGEIRETLTNLIFNAVDAMPNGGQLTLRTSVVSDGLDSTAASELHQVQVEVIDTGIGMDEETRRRCLEPFFTTKGERGTGLGLAMVYGMVERHSADISVDSTINRGTTVRLRFSVPATVIQPTHPTAAYVTPSRLRILAVDDDPIVLKSLRDTLEIDGHFVVAANGGESGIELFRESRKQSESFSVVITDLGMPHMDGRKVAATIKEISPSTPVILLTGWGKRLIDEGDIPPHVDRVLSKPPKLAELREALADCCHPTQSKGVSV